MRQCFIFVSLVRTLLHLASTFQKWYKQKFLAARTADKENIMMAAEVLTKATGQVSYGYKLFSSRGAKRESIHPLVENLNGEHHE